jgi:zinc protease
VKSWYLLMIAAVSLDTLASPQIHHWTMANGARAYFVETHQIPMVQFAVGFDAGSARDPGKLKGVANFVNEMVEEGAADMDGALVAERLESVGAEFSAWSGRDMSVFELRSLSDELLLGPAVEVFSKLMQKPTFPADAIERTRDSILVSLKRKEQSPGSVASLAFYGYLYKDHPYGSPASGMENGVRNIKRRDLLDFYREYFVGANVVIAIVGDLSIDQARSWADHIAGGLSRGAKPDPIPEAGQLNKNHSLNIEFPSSQTHLMMGQVGIARDDPDYFPLYVGNHILGGSGLISRLALDIREERGLVYSVSSYFYPMREPGPFLISLQTRNDQAAMTEGLSMDTLRGFVDQGPTLEELESARKNITGGFPLRISSNKKIASNILSIAFYELPLDYLSTFSENINNVTLEQVKDAFQRRVSPDRFLHVLVGGNQ